MQLYRFISILLVFTTYIHSMEQPKYSLEQLVFKAYIEEDEHRDANIKKIKEEMPKETDEVYICTQFFKDPSTPAHKALYQIINRQIAKRTSTLKSGQLINLSATVHCEYSINSEEQEEFYFLATCKKDDIRHLTLYL